MRKIILLLCVVTALISFCGCRSEEPVREPPQNYTHGVYMLTFSKVLIYNDSVGNDWETVYTCDGEEITGSERWTFPLGSEETATVNIILTERDQWPDVGTGTLSVTFRDGFKNNTVITVTENKGRFMGNSAQWKITCTVRLIEKV